MNLSNELELSETFRNIIEVNERLLNLNNIELAELRNHLSKRYQVLMQTVIENAPKPLNPKSDEFKALKLRTVDDDNYNSFLIKHFILKIDEIRMKQHVDKFDATIFLDIKSQLFFNYLFEHWLKHETTLNYLHFVFRKMWLKNYSKEFNRSNSFLITSSFRVFVETWNQKYLRLCRSNNLELKSFNLKTFDDIGNNVSQNLNEKFNAIERAYME
tara:strand:+ start:508 stop:1152 length:645 start_codon:yes stop_codon:yes gene_type:complete